MSNRIETSNVCSDGSSKKSRYFRTMVMPLGFALFFAMMGVMLFSGFSQAAPLLTIHIEPAPNMTPASGGIVVPGQVITYAWRVEETTGGSFDGTFWSAIPAGVALLSVDPVSTTYSGDLASGYTITWTLTGLPDDVWQYFTITAQSPVTSELGTVFVSTADMTTTETGLRSGTVNHYVRPFIDKPNTTSVVDGLNDAHHVVAGEYVTVTVFYTVPANTVAYSLTPRIQFENGLIPYDSDPAWQDFYENTTFDARKMADAYYELRFPPTDTFGLAGGVLSYTIYARAAQAKADGTLLANNIGLGVGPILRWCTSPGCAISEDATTFGLHYDFAENITFLRPQVAPTLVGPEYLDPLQQGEGSGQVRFTIQNENAAGSATAYDMILTATLGPGLEYVSATIEPDAHWGVDPTYITWTVPGSLAEGDAWPVVVTAQLPNHLMVGKEFTVATQMHQESYDGHYPGEGLYDDRTGSLSFYPPLSAANVRKTASLANMRIGEEVTYTFVFTVSPNSTLSNFRSEDALAAGLHYVTQTLSVNGAQLADVQVQPNGAVERLVWSLDDIVTADTAQVVTVSYRAWFNAIDLNGTPTFVGGRMSEYFLDDDPISNRSTFYWSAPPDVVQSLSGIDVNVLVYQSNIGALESRNASFKSTFHSFDNEYGLFTIRFTAGSGYADAYDVRICQDLPSGVTFKQATSYDDAGCGSAYTSPEVGAHGTICWEIDKVCRDTDATGDMNTLSYELLFGSSSLAGSYAPRVFVDEYTSMPGEVEGERYYSEFDYYNNDPDFINVLMETDCSSGDNCPFTIVGWGLDKVASPDTLNPGDPVVYTIAYSNTSTTNAYTNLTLVDTYDEFVSVVSAPGAQHDAVNRTLTWAIGPLSASVSRTEITFSAQVAPVIDGVYELVNNVDMTADGVLPANFVLRTPLNVALLDVALSASVTRTHASDVFNYTVVYTNSGSSTKPYTLTFDYAPGVSYDSIISTEGAAHVSDAVFVDPAVPADTVRSLTIQVTVGQPLSYALDALVSTVTVSSPGASDASDELAVPLMRPRFGVFRKTSDVPTAPSVGSVNYTVEITNTGDYIATNCVLTDTWNAGKMNFVAGMGWTSSVAGKAVWDASPFDLDPGSGVNPGLLTLQVATPDYAYYENYLDIVCDQVNEVPPFEHLLWKPSIQTSKRAGDEIAFPGRVLTYTIYYTNTSASVQNAVITDVLPLGFELLDYTTGPAGCSVPTHGTEDIGEQTHVFWGCQFLEGGAMGSLQVWGTVTAPEGEVLTNTTESNGNSVPPRDGDAPVVLLAVRPRLALTQTLDSSYASFAPGDFITYTLLYQNYGSAMANDVEITIDLPDHVEYVSGGTLTGSAVEWALGDVASGEQGTVVLVLKATTLGTVSFAGLQQIFSQRLAWDDGETLYGLPDVVTVANPSLSLTKTASPVTTMFGDPITYTLVFANDGGGMVSGITLSDVLNNSEVTYISVSNPKCSATSSGGETTVLCQGFDPLAPGEVVTVKLYVQDNYTNQVTDYAIYNTGVIDSDQTDPLTSAPARVVHNPTCVVVTDVSLDREPGGAVRVGDSVTFTAEVTPTGAGTPYNYKATYDDGGAPTTTSGTSAASPFTWNHIFSKVGAYTVTVGVWNCWLTEPEAILSNELYVTVLEPCYAPSAPSFDYSPPEPMAGETVTFTGTVTGTVPMTYTWNFGEGPVVVQQPVSPPSTIMVETSVTHAFTAGGTYTVIMTATNACGSTSYSRQIEVTPSDFYIYLPLVTRNKS